MRGFLMQNEFEMMQNDAKNRTKKYVPSGVIIIAVAGKSPINAELSIAMFDCRRVVIECNINWYW